MQVRLLATITGTRDGQDWPKRGEVTDLPSAEAVDLINAGIAEAVAVSSLETAAVERGERAVAAKPRKKA